MIQSRNNLFGVIIFSLPVLLLMVASTYPNPKILARSNQVAPAYPPPHTAATTNQNNMYKVAIPYVSPGNPRFYAQVSRLGAFTGVWAKIETASPVIREMVSSYIGLQIIIPDPGSPYGKRWVEAGWSRGTNTGCVSKFLWQTDHSSPHFYDNHLPTVGVAYQYIISYQNGTWNLKIAELNGTVLIDDNIPQTYMTYGTELRAMGEVYSYNKINDMGVSGVLNLKYMDATNTWYDWGSHSVSSRRGGTFEIA